MYDPIAVGGGVLAGGIAATTLPLTGAHTNVVAVAVAIALVVWAVTYVALNRVKDNQ